MVAAPAATSVQGCRNAASPAAPSSESRSSLAIQADRLAGTAHLAPLAQGDQDQYHADGQLDGQGSVDGTVCGLGGLFPVAG